MGEPSPEQLAFYIHLDDRNCALQIEQRDGVDVPDLERLERLEEPESLRRLRKYVGARLPPSIYQKSFSK